MNEEYYKRELRLITAERRIYRKAQRTGALKDWQAWVRASRRLVDHENAHTS